jgi:hypothetical protein
MKYQYELLPENKVLVTLDGHQTAHTVEPEIFTLLTCLSSYQKFASAWLAPFADDSEEE